MKANKAKCALTRVLDVDDALKVSRQMWGIGDWLNYGERRYSEMYAQAVEATPCRPAMGCYPARSQRLLISAPTASPSTAGERSSGRTATTRRHTALTAVSAVVPIIHLMLSRGSNVIRHLAEFGRFRRHSRRQNTRCSASLLARSGLARSPAHAAAFPSRMRSHWPAIQAAAASDPSRFAISNSFARQSSRSAAFAFSFAMRRLWILSNSRS